MAPTLRKRKGKQPISPLDPPSTTSRMRKRVSGNYSHSGHSRKSKRVKVDGETETGKLLNGSVDDTLDDQADRSTPAQRNQPEAAQSSDESESDEDEDCSWESVDIDSAMDNQSTRTTGTEDSTMSDNTVSYAEGCILSATEGTQYYLEGEPDASDHRIYNDVEIVVEQESSMRPTSSTGKSMSAYEREYLRQLRQWTHQSHVVCLSAHYKLRNTWCNQVQSACRSILPPHLTAENRQLMDTKEFLNCIVSWWRDDDQFVITGPGLLTRPYDLTYLNGYNTLRDWIDAHVSNEDGDFIPDKESFVQLKQGTRDTSAELFVAMLRSCKVFSDVRLVCSLQPVPYKIPAATKSRTANSRSSSVKADNASSTDDDTANDDDLFAEKGQQQPNSTKRKKKGNKPKFELRKPAPRLGDIPNVALKDPTKATNKPPTVWAEVYCEISRRWITVDPIRGIIDQPLAMEPNHKARDYQLSYVLAFDQHNQVTDVTRRYTAQFEKISLARERPLTKREKEAGMMSWSNLFLTQLCHRRVKTERDELEQEELAKNQARNVMPTALANYKNHPLYALERHLLTYEVIHPKTKDQIVGTIRGEAIYPRKNVQTVRTAETFHKLGRMIKKGEQPIKMVKARAVTKEKKRLKAQAKQAGEDLMVACYGEWQTEPYVPPPVIDGKVPKNQYNNIDLFTPSMLPKGAVHLPIKGIASVAKRLGIDYADAVVDFEFHKMRAVPVVDGIVVAEENKWLVLESWEEREQEKAIKAIEKQEKEAIIRWRRLIKTVLIHARVDRDYGRQSKEAASSEDTWAAFVANKQEAHDSIDAEEVEGGGGGFLVE